MKLVQHSPKQVIDRLEKLVKGKGMTVFARVDGSPGVTMHETAPPRPISKRRFPDWPRPRAAK